MPDVIDGAHEAAVVARRLGLAAAVPVRRVQFARERMRLSLAVCRRRWVGRRRQSANHRSRVVIVAALGVVAVPFALRVVWLAEAHTAAEGVQWRAGGEVKVAGDHRGTQQVLLCV